MRQPETSSELAELVARARVGLEKFEAGAVSAAQLAKGLRRVAELIEQAAGKPSLVDVKRVYDAWVSEMGKDPGRARLTPERTTKIMARMREGYTVDELLVAVRNCARSTWHRGENERDTPYDDLTLICRNGSNVERFRDMGPIEPPGTGQRALLLAPEPAVLTPSLVPTNGRYKDKGW